MNRSAIGVCPRPGGVVDDNEVVDIDADGSAGGRGEIDVRGGRSCASGSSGSDSVGKSRSSTPNSIFKDELSMGVSSFGGSAHVLDCGAVTADRGVDTDESLAERGFWRYGPDMIGFASSTSGDDTFLRLDAEDFFAKSNCRDGFLSLFPNIDEAEGESGLREPSDGKEWNIGGEKFGRERTGIERRFSAAAGGA